MSGVRAEAQESGCRILGSQVGGEFITRSNQKIFPTPLFSLKNPSTGVTPTPQSGIESSPQSWQRRGRRRMQRRLLSAGVFLQDSARRERYRLGDLERRRKDEQDVGGDRIDAAVGSDRRRRFPAPDPVKGLQFQLRVRVEGDEGVGRRDEDMRARRRGREDGGSDACDTTVPLFKTASPDPPTATAKPLTVRVGAP